ncbi:hypothetical protein CLAM6_17620 [Cobetia sp. AM6]|nr:hypothetical protein CLAM6_17620 [Cobetia sp. AM6]
MEVFMTKKTRRRYSDEFKADAVSLVSDQGYTVSEAARRLGVDRSLLDRWCRKQRQQTSGASSQHADDRDDEIKMKWSNWSGHPDKPHNRGDGGVHDQEDSTSVFR